MHIQRPATFASISIFVLALSLSGCRSAKPPDDTALNNAVQGKLTSDTAISAEPIQTFVQNGVVTLQGNVSSEAASALAASDVSQVPGIRSVTNQLTVQASVQAASPTRPILAPTPTKQRAGNSFPLVSPRTPSRQVAQATSYPTSLPPTNTQVPAPIERSPQVEQADLRRAPQPPTIPAPAFRQVTVAAGTTLPIRITQTLSSATAQSGDAFSGTLASDVVLDGLVVLPAGTPVSGRVEEVHEAAHFKGSALLTITLVSINRHGERTPIATEPYTQEGNGRGKNTAEKVGGGAAVGAILGGIFGGGKGAAIGAAAGGGLGAGANGVTRGQQVEIPSETLIRFRLANSIEVRTSTAPAGAEGDASLQRHSGN